MKNEEIFKKINWDDHSNSKLTKISISNEDWIKYIKFDNGLIVKEMHFKNADSFFTFFDIFFRICNAEDLDFIQYMTLKNDHMFDWFISAEWEPYLLEDTEDGLVFMVYDIKMMEKLNFFRSGTEK